MPRKYSRSGMEHFCTGIKRADLAAFVAMCERDAANSKANAERYRLAARNNARRDAPDKQTRADSLWDRMRDHSNPQMELNLATAKSNAHKH